MDTLNEYMKKLLMADKITSPLGDIEIDIDIRMELIKRLKPLHSAALKKARQQAVEGASKQVDFVDLQNGEILDENPVSPKSKKRGTL